jgi:hypothetical protein
MPPKEKEIPWRKSKAKKLLQDDIKNRVITDTMKARDVYNMRLEYQEYRYDRFQANLRALHKLFELRETEAVEDQADFYHDCQLHPRSELTSRGCPYWDTSVARQLLLQDIEDGLHEIYLPSILWQTSNEYQKFPMITFRDHIYQEIRSVKGRAYWENYYEKKALKKKG